MSKKLNLILASILIAISLPAFVSSSDKEDSEPDRELLGCVDPRWRAVGRRLAGDGLNDSQVYRNYLEERYRELETLRSRISEATKSPSKAKEEPLPFPKRILEFKLVIDKNKSKADSTAK